MTNFDKLLQDPESRKFIIEHIALHFCIDMNKMVIDHDNDCDECRFRGEENCDELVLEWLHEEYVEGGE